MKLINIESHYSQDEFNQIENEYSTNVSSEDKEIEESKMEEGHGTISESDEETKEVDDSASPDYLRARELNKKTVGEIDSDDQSTQNQLNKGNLNSNFKGNEKKPITSHGVNYESDTIQLFKEYYVLYKQVFFLAIQAVLVFVITFMLYPGTLLSSHFNFLSSSSSAKAWFNILMITIFSFGDTVGRYLANHVVFFTPNNVILLTLSR